MIKFGTAVISALVASAAFALPAQASPVPVDLNNCSATADITPDADACDGYFSNLNTDGNEADTLFLANVLNQWGLSLDPEYKDDNTSKGTSTTSLFDAYAGRIDLLAPISGAFAIGIKAGNFLGLYYFDATRSFGAGDYFTFTIPSMEEGKNPPGLSHVSIFGGGGTTVPEPTTLALLGLGLAGLGLSRRRK